MKNKNYLKGAAVLLIAAFGLSLAACGGANSAKDFSYDLTADGQGILIKGYTGKPGKVVVPAKIEKLPVLEIGDNAFDGKSMTFSIDINSGSSNVGSKDNEKAGITSITIPDTVRKLGTSAFANTAITKFNMPDSVKEIAYNSLGWSFLFSGCSKLTEIRFSDNIEIFPESIGGFNLPALKKVNIPKNLKILAGFPTGGELTTIIIPDTLTSIEFVVLDQNSRRVKYPFPGEERDYGIGWDPARENYDRGDPRSTFTAINEFKMFNGCSKLPLATRQRLTALGYKGEF